jgi:uncharacterized protein (TIGR02145 family)
MPDGKIWMAENINFQPQNGNSWCYMNDSAYCAMYGRLYDWNTAMAACPAGWHLATAAEWESLVELAGGTADAGEKLKAASGWRWNKSDDASGNGTDNYGFSALPGGDYGDSDFGNAGNYGFWWTATEYSEDGAYMTSIYSYDIGIGEKNTNKKNLRRSARCVMDGR